MNCHELCLPAGSAAASRSNTKQTEHKKYTRESGCEDCSEDLQDLQKSVAQIVSRDRIGEEFQDLQADFFELKTQKKRCLHLCAVGIGERILELEQSGRVTGKLKDKKTCKMDLQSLYTEPTTAMTTEENPMNTCDENMWCDENCEKNVEMFQLLPLVVWTKCKRAAMIIWSKAGILKTPEIAATKRGLGKQKGQKGQKSCKKLSCGRNQSQASFSNLSFLCLKLWNKRSCRFSTIILMTKRRNSVIPNVSVPWEEEEGSFATSLGAPGVEVVSLSTYDVQRPSWESSEAVYSVIQRTVQQRLEEKKIFLTSCGQKPRRIRQFLGFSLPLWKI